MIHIFREPRRYPPDILVRIDKSLRELKGYFSIPRNNRIQSTPPFNLRALSVVKKLANDQFHGKCSYCETKLLGGSRGELDQFRPKHAAVGLSGESRSDHYWWLVYDWENLYYCCQKCNFSKGNKFPVRGRRGRAFASVNELRQREDALLVDPCFDLPSDHLDFVEDGQVIPLTEKGEVSIDVLTLNRPDLIEARRHEIETFLGNAVLLKRSKSLTVEWVRQSSRPHDAYTAAKIHCLLRSRMFGSRDRSRIRNLLGGIDDIDRSSRVFPQAPPKTKKKKEEAAVSTMQGRRSLYSKNIFIRKIRLYNFRKIHDLTIEFPVPTTGSKPWLMLIGENSMGKSSILKAVALTLMEDKLRGKLKLDARSFVRNNAESGFVQVFVEGYSIPFRLDFKKDSREFISNNVALQSLLFCYGGTRLLPTMRSRKLAVQDDYSRLGNLFDPFCPLTDATKWLLSLDDVKFEYGAKAIKNLFTADDNRNIVRVPEKNPKSVHLESETAQTSNRLDVLSDGYQSVIALVADILSIALKHFNEAQNAEGIVLLDEIDVHLHPRWKVEIVKLLRTVFPRMQFILTTHDPLCLLGTNSGEVHLLESHFETNQVIAIQRDIQPGTTADQILTGLWFGLRSTLDEGTLSLLDKHRRILRGDVKSSKKTRAERAKIESELRKRLGSFGDTSIERMAQSVAADLMQKDIRDFDFSDRDTVRKQIKQNLERLIAAEEGKPDATV